jgi:hypothetical protein
MRVGAGPLLGLRIAATLPPGGWFGGVDHEFARDMQRDLIELGAEVFSLPVDPFLARDRNQIYDAIEALESFRADVAISLANAGYALLCVTPEGENVFRDVLGIPTLMIWDHGPLQFSNILLRTPPSAPEQAIGDCIRRFREALDHPLYVHYSPDRGHIATLDRMGVIPAGSVGFFLQPAYPCYERYGRSAPPSGPANGGIAFFGNVYLQASDKLSFRNHTVLKRIETSVLAAKRDSITASLWDLTMAEIDGLDRKTRERLRLDPDSSFFWRFVEDLIQTSGNTAVRLAVLKGLNRDLDFFGNFIEPTGLSTLRRPHGIQYRQSVNCVTELPELYAKYEITADVINQGYNTGSSPKITACLAAGGLPLFDYKPDFHDGMGEPGDQLMYRSVEELNTKVEEYLTHPTKRREVIRELQARVLSEFTFGGLCKRILVDKPLWRSRANPKKISGPGRSMRITF